MISESAYVNHSSTTYNLYVRGKYIPWLCIAEGELTEIEKIANTLDCDYVIERISIHKVHLGMEVNHEGNDL